MLRLEPNNTSASPIGAHVSARRNRVSRPACPYSGLPIRVLTVETATSA